MSHVVLCGNDQNFVVKNLILPQHIGREQHTLETLKNKMINHQNPFAS